MNPNPFLHNLDDFDDLLAVVSGELDIVPQLVEKDYWIMHCLHGLAAQGFSFTMKGGTSLSKGYKIINRFSEDIDLQIDPPPGMDVKTGKNHTKPAHIQSRIDFFDWLANEINIPGVEDIEIDHEYDDPSGKHRNIGIRLKYPSRLTRLKGLKEGILLEVGFDDTTPNDPMDISSWAFDKARTAKVHIIDNRARAIRCYRPEYTFVEKLQTVSTKYRLQQSKGTFQKNFLRHYYDIYCLLETPDVLSFTGTADYENHKKKRFPKQDELNINKNEAFLFSNPEIRAQYEKEYKKTADLYHKEFVPFDTILKRIHAHIDKL